MDQKQYGLLEHSDLIRSFSSLPNEALVDLKVVSALASRSRSSIYRDIQREQFAEPVRLGKNTSRWRVKDVRAYLNGN